MRIFYKMADNGKRLCEVREFEELIVQEFQNVANGFFRLLNYKKIKMKSQFADKYLK